MDQLYNNLSRSKQSMASLLAMSDWSECYYADKYIKSRSNYSTNNAENMSLAYEKGSRCFILSCTSKEDEDRKMWNDYGSYGTGVRMCFENNDKDANFFVAPISYAQTKDSHQTLNFIVELERETYNNYQFKIKDWEIWQHFFKPYDFRSEKEIRMLYVIDKDKKEKNESDEIEWIKHESLLFPLIYFGYQEEKRIFPFTFKEIILGPLSGNIAINKVVIEQMLLKKGFDIEKINVRRSEFSSELE